MLLYYLSNQDELLKESEKLLGEKMSVCGCVSVYMCVWKSWFWEEKHHSNAENIFLSKTEFKDIILQVLVCYLSLIN